MNIERYDDTNLELFYKKVLTCEKCGRKYGQDTPNPKNILCPFCERELFHPRGRFRKKENGHEEERTENRENDSNMRL